MLALRRLWLRALRQRSGRHLSGAAFLNGSNATYTEAMFEKWRQEPTSVHASWDVYFRTGAFASPPPSGSKVLPQAAALSGPDHTELKVATLVRAYQTRGHLLANLDPLGIAQHGVDRGLVSKKEFELDAFELTKDDLKRRVNVSVPGQKGFQDPARKPIEVSKLISRLRDVYATSMAVEYMHIPCTDQCNWIREKLETPEKLHFSKEDRLRFLDRLTWADHFERFLAKKWSTAKRFGVEGAEALIPGMKELIDTAAFDGCTDVVIGMPHRGRLNVLANVVRKPLQQIFCEFHGGGDVSEFEGSGDVKYHLGMSFNRPVRDGGGNVHLSLVANPSHLEAVNPVVAGKVRAKQFFAGDKDTRRVMPILLHGDAAFSGQGVVYESMGLHELPDYTVGGSVHIIANNQIGFTTDPSKSRSTPYCSDLAKAFNCPIFHVNGDDLEAVIRVCCTAAQYRQRFKKDVVIDLVCYRKYGHNEIDEPMFTQPRMYTAIMAKKSPLELYHEKLLSNNHLSQEEIDEISQKTFGILEDSYEKAQKSCTVGSDWLSSNWSGLSGPSEISKRRVTGMEESVLQSIGKKLYTVPDGFQLHRRLQTVFKHRESMFKSKEGFDWGTAEALAFGSLLLENIHVRLSGQDVERGTFSHRHAVVHDQSCTDVQPYVALSQLSADQAQYTVSNSSLSEYGVLGFELGYSLENPNALVVFEAQFGDFINTAQVIIDQFISSGEAKWLRQSGLTVVLPHGFEGQGPEHSSARMERFLQMSSDPEDEVPDEDGMRLQIQSCNWQIVVPSTPASYFHALRRQVHRNFRKPLIVFNPKSLLRHKRACSSLSDMSGDSIFQRLLGETDEAIVSRASDVKRAVFCTGKVYYDLLQHRMDNNINDVALIRVEQLTPFPFDKVLEQAQLYANAEIMWAQEEPRNMGAWSYVCPRIRAALKDACGNVQPKYAGRKASASPATGFPSVHKRELGEILETVFTL